LVDESKWRDTTLRLFLCDDNGVRRRRLMVTLERQPDLLVVAEAAEVRAVVAIAEHAPTDVVVTSNMLPPVGAARVLAGVRVHSPAAVGVVVGLPDEVDEAVAAVRNGAIAFIAREAVESDVATVVRHAALGLPVLPREVVQALLAEFDRLTVGGIAASDGVRPPRPTDAEIEVLTGVAGGANWATLGERLEVPPESAARIAANALARLVRHQETIGAAQEAGLLTG
jgi:DNA-binding NarL/FixJ family response regulator